MDCLGRSNSMLDLTFRAAAGPNLCFKPLKEPAISAPKKVAAYASVHGGSCSLWGLLVAVYGVRHIRKLLFSPISWLQLMGPPTLLALSPWGRAAGTSPFRRIATVVQIRALERVHMTHEIQHAVPLQHASSSRHGDFVARFDGQVCIDLDVRINHDKIAHLARTQVVHISDAGRFNERAPKVVLANAPAVATYAAFSKSSSSSTSSNVFMGSLLERPSELRMETHGPHRHRPSVTVVRRVIDILIVDRELSVRQHRRVVVGFQDLFGSRMRQFPIADQDAEAARVQVSLTLSGDSVVDQGKSRRILGAAPCRALQRQSR